MGILRKDKKFGERKPTVIVTKKDIKQEREDDKGNLETILDIIGRPSRAVAGAANAAVKLENPVSRAWDNLTGEKKDQWSKNIAEATGIAEDSWTARGGGFVGDAVLDPLNLLSGAGAASKIVGGARKGIQGIQAASKAGKYGDAAKAVANTAKSVRGVFSNYAGLTPDEQALVQLFDATKHSLDDRAKEKVIEVLNETNKLIKKSPSRELEYKAAGINTAIDEGKTVYKQMLENSQQKLRESANKKFGGNLSPDMEEHLGRRLQFGQKVPKGQKKFAQDHGPMMAGYLRGVSGNSGAKLSERPLRWAGDKALGVDRAFKTQATRYNPLFYVNNMMGNVQQAMQEASKDGLRGYADVAEAFAREYGNKVTKRLGKDISSPVKGMSGAELERLGKSRGVRTNVSSIYKGRETGGSLEETLGEMAKVYFDMQPGRSETLLRKGARALGPQADKAAGAVQKAGSHVKNLTTRGLDTAQSLVEGDSRQAAFNAFLKQELRKNEPTMMQRFRGITPPQVSVNQAADNAALRTTQALFDYEDITPGIRAIRAMPVVGQPFITWGAKNIPRQTAMLAKNPQFLAKIEQAQNMFDGPENSEDYVPGYMRERGSFALNKTGDKTTFFNPALAASDINQLPINFNTGEMEVEPLVKGTHPLGKMLYELASNKDTFTGMNIASNDTPVLDRPFAPQSVPADMRWLLEQAPGLFDSLGASRARTTGNPQAPYWLKKGAEYPVALRNLLRGVHSAVDPENATDKTPLGLGAILPIDVKTDKQLKVSKQFEDKRYAAKAKYKKIQERPKRRLKRLAAR